MISSNDFRNGVTVEIAADGEQSFVFIDPEDPEYDKVCEAYEKLMDSEPYEA